MSAALKVLKILSSTETGKKLIGAATILLLMFLLLAPALLVITPVAVVSTPFSWLLADNTREKIEKEYVAIMVQYKEKMNTKIREKKQSEEGTGVSIAYPSLSLVVAYDNAKHPERYNADDPSKVEVVIEADVLSNFLDTTVVYSNENGIITSRIKDINTIANETFIDDEEGKSLFIAYYNTLSNTDLDNKVPDVPFKDILITPGGVELPYFSQYDNSWSESPFGSSTIGKSGCGVTSLAMVVSGLLNKDVYPPEIGTWGSSYYVPGAGASWSLLPATATKYGLTIKNLTRSDPDSIVDELMYNHPVIVSMSPGHFTTGGHFIVLRGFDEDGKVIVSDPASLERSNTTWDFSIILTESSTLSEYCFWSFALPEQ